MHKNGHAYGSDMRIKGPKKPTTKEIPPITIELVYMAAMTPISSPFSDFQVNQPTMRTIGIESHVATMYVRSVICSREITSNKYVKNETARVRVGRISFFISDIISYNNQHKLTQGVGHQTF